MSARPRSLEVLALVAPAVLAAPSAPAAELPAVATFELGALTLHVATRPFRWSWFLGEARLGAERYRRQSSSLWLHRGGRWMPLEGVLSIRRASQRRVDVEVSCDAGRSRATVELESLAGEGGEVARLRLSAPGASGVRDEVILEPDEMALAASGEPRLVVASGPCAFWLRGGDGKGLRAYAPDPDHYRFEADGERFELELWPGGPKEALARRDRLPAAARRAAEAIPVAALADLPGAARQIDSDSLSPGGVRPLRFTVAAPGGALRDAVASLAAVLPSEFRVEGPAAARLERLHSALRALNAPPFPPAVRFPSQRDAWRSSSQWLLGEDVIAAPLLGAAARDIWLPPGDWVRIGAVESALATAGPGRIRVEAEPAYPVLLVRRERADIRATLQAAWSGER